MLHRLISVIIAALTAPGRAGPEWVRKFSLGVHVWIFHLAAPMIPAFQSTLGEKTLMLSAALLVLFLLLGHMASMIEYIAQESSRIVLAASNFGLDLVYCVAKVFSFVKWLRHRSPSSFYRRAGHWVERKPPARAEFPGRISPIVSVKKARGGRRRA